MADFFPNGYFDPDYWGEGYFHADVAGSIGASLSGSGAVTATLTTASGAVERGDDAGKPKKKRRSIVQVPEYWVESENPLFQKPKVPKVRPVPKPAPVVHAAVEAIDYEDEDELILMLAA